MASASGVAPFLILAVVLAACVALPGPVAAQLIGPGIGARDRPFATERETPTTQEAPGERKLGEEGSERVLPGVPLPSEAERETLGAEAGIVVTELELVGNTVIEEAALREAAAPYLGRPIDSADLERLRRALTAVYVHAGYVSSGARLPEQDVRDGRLRVEITEGRLAEIRIVGARHYRESVLRRRLARAEGPPVRIAQDPRIARLDARLEPGTEVGRSRLFVAVEENDPARAGVAFDNYQSPSVGSYAGHADVAHENPLGLGDRLAGEVSVSEGLYRVAGHYSIPLHASGTELGFEARYSDAEIVEPALDELDIGNESLSLSARLGQTLYRTPQDWLEAGLSFDVRQSRSTIFGDEGFAFSEGTDYGRSELRVLRFDAAWTRRLRSAALTLRSIASGGLDALGATMHRGDVPGGPVPSDDLPEGVFFSWVGQLRYFHRFAATGIELDLAGDVQLADRALLPLEQFVIGGPGSVRGYRTNQLAGDEGFSSGLEVRLPLWRTDTGRTIVALAPFAEVGRVSFKGDQDASGKRTLSSLGAGLEWVPRPDLSLRFDWGGALRDSGPKQNLQDHGVTFRVSWRIR
jgi:hemolysin activation/secretion protein